MLAERIKSHFVANLQSVVDLGCGWRGAPDVIGHISTRIGVEWVEKTLERSKQYYTKTYCMDVRKWVADNTIERKADLYLMLDFLEHLSKQEGLELLTSIERLAAKQILVFVPEGFVPVPPPECLDENPGWSHESEWTRKDFLDLGYHVDVLEKFHMGTYNAMIVWKILKGACK